MQPLKLSVSNGLSPAVFKAEVLDINGVGDQVEMVASHADADIVVFGPYGGDIPPPGAYLRVAYICENLRYDGPAVDFVFRVPSKNASGLSSARIQWHGFDPQQLVKPATRDVDAICRAKERFCVFLYSNPVPYREMLFEALSKYKRIDAPGRSMNNHASIDADAVPGESRWETKRRFLRRYKFTLALESEMHPGYQTEKLYDPMLADSVPVYIGDRDVTSIFNDKSFINLSGGEAGYWVRRLEDFAQLRWFEIVGPRRSRPDVRLMRKLRRLARDAGHKHFALKITAALVDRLVTLDRDPEAYRAMQTEPWLRDNRVPAESYSTSAWLTIFEKARSKSGRSEPRAA